MKFILAAIPLVLLAACQSPTAGLLENPDLCKAGARQSLVGTPISSLDQSALPKLSRVIHPKSAVTMDYRQDRLNVYVGEDGKIEKVTCG
ncbi:I78 family peptidase inhibitor [Castellaniella sp. GW247-6E4]|uniref:I78 family peptidase inhibitor n=1 Tax=Castellaniella sp. GW247-6E4 TaxID=3140380 RepID=UPI00331531F3